MTDDANDREVIVLGAGMVGICSALSLLDRGYRVRLIDRGAPGQETSMGNAGVISPWSVVPQSLPGVWASIPAMMRHPWRPLAVHPRYWPRMIPWGLRFLRNANEAKTRQTSDTMAILCGPSIDLFRKHLRGTGHEHLVKDSAYIHAFRKGDAASLQGLGYRIRWEKGARLELVGSDTLRTLEPALSPDFQAAVVIHDQARAMSPGKIGTVLADKARSLGAEILQDDILAVDQSDQGWSVRCRGATHSAPRIVLCLGAWSRDMLKPLGLDLPLVTERGYHVEYADPSIEIRNSVMDVDAKVVASSMEDGIRIAGQAEFGPLDAPPDHRRKSILKDVATSMFPDLEGSDTRFWMGRRPSFPDGLPILGEVPGHPGLHVNFGHCHFGLMMAPMSGEVLAMSVAGQTPNMDVSAIAPARFMR